MLALFDRQGQVWEDSDGWIYYIVASPRVSTFDLDGKPFQFCHETLVIEGDELRRDWPLYETEDRPLEHNEAITRLA